MPLIRLTPAFEQVAARLQEEILSGHWRGEIPGSHWLANEFGVNHKTVEAALKHLEAGGLLKSQGPGRRRRIELPDGKGPHRRLRVAVLAGEQADCQMACVAELRHTLVEAGHSVFHPKRTMLELGMDKRRIARLVEREHADAWVVLAGSREVLEWFASQPIPAFALFGRRRGLPLAGAGPDKPPKYTEATRTLLELGHRRIVLLARPRRLLPEPGASERAFVAEMQAHGVNVTSYHLPNWNDNAESLQRRLHSLFEVTPPTAMIIEEVLLFNATYHFLAGRGLRVPDDVSMICTDDSPDFDWCRPKVSHIRWDSQPVIQRVVRWTESLARGKRDLRQTHTRAEFVIGGTIARAR